MSSVSPTRALAIERVRALSPSDLLKGIRGSEWCRRAVELGQAPPFWHLDSVYEIEAHWSREKVFADALDADVSMMRTHVEGFAEVLDEVERIPVDVVRKALAMGLIREGGRPRLPLARSLPLPMDDDPDSRQVRRRLLRWLTRVSRRWLSAVASLSDGDDVLDALDRRSTPLDYSDWIGVAETRLQVREAPIEGPGRRFVIVEAGARTESDVDLVGVDLATAVQVLVGEVPEGWEVVVDWEAR